MVMEEFGILRSRLLENKNWPLTYMFKFIVPNESGKVNQIVELLPDNGKNSFKNTKNLRYVSVTCVVDMQSADDIIYTIKQALNIEGVMSL
jgi:uncharacterized protein